MTDWLTYFRDKGLRFRTIDMASPDTTDYKWNITGCIHPGYNDRDLTLFITGLGDDGILALDEAGAKDLHLVLTGYLQWIKETGKGEQ